MNYLTIYKDCISDGPGVRVSLYVSGCRNHCQGCHNPESWDFCAGSEFTKEVEDEIIGECTRTYVKGLTLCGGDPCEPENQKALVKFLEKFRSKCIGKDVWLYTGYELSDLLPSGKKYIDCTDEFLSYIDVAVVGPFILSERDISDANRWRGSRNQRVLDLQKSLEAGKPIMLGGIPNNQ